MGGGILPIAVYQNDYYVLMGRESVDNKWRDSGKWSDFGGSREGRESEYQTAIREGTEETSGILGNTRDIKRLIDNSFDIISMNKYSTYLVEIKYDTFLPYKFNKKYRHILKTNSSLIYKRNGLYEKDKIRWIKVDNLIDFKQHVRFWFRPFIDKIYSKYSTIYRIDNI